MAGRKEGGAGASSLEARLGQGFLPGISIEHGVILASFPPGGPVPCLSGEGESIRLKWFPRSVENLDEQATSLAGKLGGERLMKDPSGTRTRPEKGHDVDSPHPVEEIPQRAPSVPEGKRPVLIVEPGLPGRDLLERSPLSGKKRKDPLLGPEVLAARAKTEAFKVLGEKFSTLSGVMGGFLAELRARLLEAESGGEVRPALEVLGWLEETHKDLDELAAWAAAGMAEIELSSLIRDAVKRAHPGNSRIRFRIPGLEEKCLLTGHPQHMLDALTLAVTILLKRIQGRGEIVVTLARNPHYAEVQVTGIPLQGEPKGELPGKDEVARLRHLVVGLHEGSLFSETGPGGEPLIRLGFPLKRF